MGSCFSKTIKHLTMGEQLDHIQEQLQKQYEQSISRSSLPPYPKN